MLPVGFPPPSPAVPFVKVVHPKPLPVRLVVCALTSLCFLSWFLSSLGSSRLCRVCLQATLLFSSCSSQSPRSISGQNTRRVGAGVVGGKDVVDETSRDCLFSLCFFFFILAASHFLLSIRLSFLAFYFISSGDIIPFIVSYSPPFLFFASLPPFYAPSVIDASRAFTILYFKAPSLPCPLV